METIHGGGRGGDLRIVTVFLKLRGVAPIPPLTLTNNSNMATNTVPCDTSSEKSNKLQYFSETTFEIGADIRGQM